jgi:MoaA/NifB/PqqE/SkfB family radical SAM enzyme
MENTVNENSLKFIKKDFHIRPESKFTGTEIQKKQDLRFVSKILREIPCRDKETGHPFEQNLWRDYRKKWTENPAKGVLEDLPLQIDLWAVDACNLKCPMCPRTLGHATNKIMKPELIEKIFDEISKSHLYSLNLGGLGEPTMLPKWTDYIKRAKDMGVVDVNGHSNGTLLRPDFNRKVIESGLDRLVISLDAVTKERFEQIRVGANYERVYAQVNDLIEQRDKMNSKTPHIKLNIIDVSVGDDIDEEIYKFTDYWQNKVERIAVLPLFEYDEKGREVAADMLNRTYLENFSCGWLWQRMSILVDGNVTTCLRDTATKSDIIGNIRENSIHEVWHNEKMNSLRKLHASGRYREHFLCTYCPNAVAATDNLVNA